MLKQEAPAIGDEARLEISNGEEEDEDGISSGSPLRLRKGLEFSELKNWGCQSWRGSQVVASACAKEVR